MNAARAPKRAGRPRWLARLGRVALNVVATLVGSRAILDQVLSMPENMPAPVENGLRFALHLVGHDEMANADDMEMLAWLLYFSGSLIAAGVIVWGVNRVAVRVARRLAARDA